jgi:hypothetical protein
MARSPKRVLAQGLPERLEFDSSAAISSANYASNPEVLARKFPTQTSMVTSGFPLRFENFPDFPLRRNGTHFVTS